MSYLYTFAYRWWKMAYISPHFNVETTQNSKSDSISDFSIKCTHRWPDSNSFQDWNCSILACWLFTRGYGEFGCQWIQWRWSCEKIYSGDRKQNSKISLCCQLIWYEMVLCYKLCSFGAECRHHVFISWSRNLQYLNFQRAEKSLH